MLNIISLGAGVQSSTIALMAARGEITPMPDGAIFADTGAEPKVVYEWLDWLEKQLPFPVYRVRSGNLRADIEAGTNSTGQIFSPVPWHMYNADGSKGFGRRQCTREYKLKPIRKKMRQLVGLSKGQRAKEVLVHQWIGISSDEAQRMKLSMDNWMVNRFPLYDMRMSRNSCLKWMADKGYPAPPRSACTFCPFKSAVDWRALRDGPQDEWLDAIKVDRLIRDQPKNGGKQYAHSSRVPLEDVDFSTAEEKGQGNLFNIECEGMCGV